MALVMEHLDREAMQEVAIEEWMAASPIYSRRMQQTMNFVGTGVDTIMKNLQLDIGAPHEFMDFRYRLADPEHGEFWLAHCGALLDVEPMGEAFVHGMCHAIEDPTFDATAGATNPLAQVRPIHRPPRVPADRMPHCRWRVDIVPGADLVTPHANQAVIEQSRIAKLPIHHPSAMADDVGMVDYAGEFDPGFQLEALAPGALRVVLREFAIQSQLLLRALLLAVTQRLGEPVARSMVPRLIAGWGGLTAARLRDAFGLAADVHGLAAMLRLHPMLHPAEYVAATVAVQDDAVVRLSFGDGIGFDEADHLSWLDALGGTADDALAQLVHAFDPRATLTVAESGSDERFSYRIMVDPRGEPTSEAPELQIARISGGASFRFARPTARLLPTSTGLV